LQYRQLGRTGIEVSAFGLGVMTFGGQTAEDDAFRQLDMAFAAGVTLFDTAEVYPLPMTPGTQGESEAILGRWIASRGLRDRVVVATKVAAFGGFGYVRGEARRLDAANIRAAVEASLHRLGTDYIDLYQVHWAERPLTMVFQRPGFREALRPSFAGIVDRPDAVPIAETVAALDALVAEGKLRAVGVCNESAWGLMQYLNAAGDNGRVRIASIQNAYNLLDRRFEQDLAEFAIREQVPLIGYSPLAGGGLTGKYGADPKPIAGSRSSHIRNFVNRLGTGRLAAIEAYAELAQAHGLELPQLALAFAAQQPFMASVLMAASRAGQLEANLKAVDMALPGELVEQVNAIHDLAPNPQ